MVKHGFNNPRCAKWAGMGMGKTSETLWFLDTLKEAGEDPFPALVTGPLRVARDVWPDEARKWENFQHLRVQPIIGDLVERKAALRNDKAHLYTVNYEVLPWLIHHLHGAWPFKTVINDEATRLKNLRIQGGGARAAALSQIAFHPAIRRWIELTGAPAPNGLIDLWGQIWYLDQGQRLGRTFTDFQNRWFGYQRAKDALNANRTFVKRVVFPHAQAEIEALLKDICLTVDPADWFDLEQPIHKTVTVKLPKIARFHYREMEKELFTQIKNKDVEAFSTGGKSIKLLQMASGFSFTKPDASEWEDLHDEKTEALKSIIEEAGGAPIIVAYHFRPTLYKLLKAIKGSVDLNTQAGMKAFKLGQAQVGIGHPQSIGHGTDGLQYVCNIVVFFTSWWDLDPDQQFIDRVGPTRQAQAGFKRPTWVYRIVAEKSVDEDVVERLTSKRSVQDVLLEAMKRRGG
jgi:hypothetical protein